MRLLRARWPKLLACSSIAVVALNAGAAQAARMTEPSAFSCRATTTPLAYGWPLKPLDRPHPVRGDFGDPRTIYWGFRPEIGDGGSFNFHNGIDVSAAPGTLVYPVVSGRVDQLYFDEVVVRSSGRRSFQYWHIQPQVREGQTVTAGETPIGAVMPELDHVHLTEIDHGRVVNPLAQGHLCPYRTHTPPVIKAIHLRPAATDVSGRVVLSGRVWFIAEAYALPNEPSPPPWGDRPVTPAYVAWSLTTRPGRMVVPLRVAADFRLHLPAPRFFWRTYAAGTYQNQPVIGATLQHLPGRYLFDLTPGGFDTRRLPNGGYRLRVIAADIRGLETRRSEPFAVRNVPRTVVIAARQGGVFPDASSSTCRGRACSRSTSSTSSGLATATVGAFLHRPRQPGACVSRAAYPTRAEPGSHTRYAISLGLDKLPTRPCR